MANNVLYQNYVKYLTAFSIENPDTKEKIRDVMQGDAFSKIPIQELQQNKDNPNFLVNKLSISEEVAKIILKTIFLDNSLGKYMEQHEKNPGETAYNHIIGMPHDMIITLQTLHKIG